MKGIYQIFISISIVFFTLSPLYGDNILSSNATLLSLDVDVVNHETCPSNGIISFIASSSNNSEPISYSIYLVSDLSNPIAVTEENELGGLVANEYKVVASQVINDETFSLDENIIILDQLIPFDYVLEISNEYCNSDGGLTVNLQSGQALSFEITSGPETRPSQTSPEFLDLPSGNFVLEIIDSCNEVYVSQFTIQHYGNDFRISNSINNLVACDEIELTTYIIREGNASLIYPLEYTYTVHPPADSGLPDEVVTYTLSSGPPVTTTHIKHNIPFYGAGNIYTYDLSVIDGCGEEFTIPTITVNKSLVAYYNQRYDDCKDYFQLTFSTFQGPLYLEFLEAPSGFDPYIFNDIYPGPYPEANYGHLNPVIFQNDSISAPTGLYRFKLTDACGQEYIGSRILENDGLTPYSPLVSTDCIEGYGNVYVYWQSDVTEIKIVDAPEEFEESLPYDVSEYMKYSDRVVVQSLPPGNYSFEALDSCGNYSISEVTAVAYEEYGLEYEIIPQCGSFNIFLDHQSNYFSQHDAVSSINEYFVLQKYDSNTDEWKNLNGTVHDPNILIATASYDFFQGGFTLTNGGLTSNIQDSGHFRILRVIKKATQSSEVTLENCEETLVEFDYEDDGLFFDEVYKFQCDDLTYDIACIASGVAPIQYRITSYEGDPISIENGNESVFTSLSAGLYNVQVEDPCGNIRNKQVDLTSISFPNIFADLCDGEDGSLSIIDLPYLSYEWTKTDNPNLILGEEATLVFDNFDSSEDAGMYQVRIFYDSPEACIDQTINYDIPAGSGPPDAGENTTQQVCNDVNDIDLLQLLDETADLNGLWFDEFENQIFTPGEYDLSDHNDGTYVFEYRVEGICAGSEISVHTINIISCNQAPEAVCMDVTINVDANCQAFINPSMIDGGSSDPDLDELVLSLDNEGPFEIGTHTVTLTVSDGALSSSCNAELVVQDGQAPTVSCQEITVNLDEDGIVTIDPEEISDGTSDNCSIASLQLSETMFTCEDVGTQQITLTAADEAGNMDSCEVSIHIVDNTPPELTCSDVTIQLDESGSATLLVEDLNVDVNDACGIENMELNIDQFECYLGTYYVILTVEDMNGNVSSCEIEVTVTGNDEDCDTVHDACDLCNGGDDRIDNNGDGLADCAYPPNFDDIINDWKCGNDLNKVLVCHVPPGSPENAHTICISPNAVDVHVGNHGGDYLGECFYMSCEEGRVSVSVEDEIDSDLKVILTPIPATNYLYLSYENDIQIDKLQIVDMNGRTVNFDAVNNNGNIRESDISFLNNGIYLLHYEIQRKSFIKKFVVLK